MKVELVTKGIKISVKSKFVSVIQEIDTMYHLYNYFITIENTTPETVQLVSRLWFILDSLQHQKIVKGSGVIGEMPVLASKQIFAYQSNCVLTSNIGAMKGYFNMRNLTTNTIFRVVIPTFQLTNTVALN